jgi:hypothetical protein
VERKKKENERGKVILREEKTTHVFLSFYQWVQCVGEKNTSEANFEKKKKT